MRRLLACLPLLALTAAATPPTPSVLLDEAIGKVKAMSYRTRQVDWPALEAKVHARAEGAKDIVDLLPALETLVNGLGDKHSFINASDEDRAAYKVRTGHEFFEGHDAKKPTSTFMGRREASVAGVRAGNGRALHLVVPTMIGGGPKASAYAQTLYDGIAKSAATMCGYVVDLRGNGGGNVWPMLLGLSPLLGNPWNGYDLTPSGEVRPYATVWNGKVTIIDKKDPNVGATFLELAHWKPLPSLVFKPVAVLTDDAVGSSGEGVTVAFRHRPRTRSFGQATYGVASSNEGFMLADRVNIVVTTGLMIDRLHNTYPDGLAPDEAVAMTAGGDAVMDRALGWMGQQDGCR